MASNIRVVLEVDNKKYIAEIKAAERSTKQFADTSERSLSRLDRTVDGVGKQFGRLKAVLAGAAFAAIGRSLFALADELDDLSNATGLATGRLIEFRNALEQSGGAPGDMTAGILKFSGALDTAAEGSITAQNSLIGLGVSMNQLRTRSQGQILINVLEQLAQMEAGARRTALMVEFFGKSFRTVDPKQLLENLKATRGEGDAYARSVATAAELSGKLEKAFANLRLVLLNSFAPTIEQFSKFVDVLQNNREQIAQLITVLKILAILVATAFAVTGLLLLVKAFGTLLRGIGAVVTVLQNFSRLVMSKETVAVLAKVAAGTTNVGSKAAVAAAAARTLGGRFAFLAAAGAPLLTALRGLAILVGTVGTSIYAASLLFDNFGDIAVNAVSRVLEFMGQLAADLLNLPRDIRTSLLGLVGVKIDNPFGLGDGLEAIVNRARQAREELEKTRRAARARTEFAATDPRRTPTTPDAAGGGVPVDETAKQNAIKSIQDIGHALDITMAKRQAALRVETASIGIAEAEAEVLKTAVDVRQEVGVSIQQLIDKRASLNKEEAFLKPIIDQQIAALSARTETEVAGVLLALRGKQARAAADRLETQNIQGLVDLENLRAQVLGFSFTEQEKFNRARAGGIEFRNKTEAEVAALQKQAVATDALTGKLNLQKGAREFQNTLLELETQLLGTQFSAVQKLEQLKTANPEAFARKTADEVAELEAQAVRLDELTGKFRSLAFARDILNQGQDFAQGLRDEMSLQTAVGEAARRRIQTEIEGRNSLQAKVREINQSYGEESQLSDAMRQQRANEIAEAAAGIGRLQEVKAAAVTQDQADRDTFEFGFAQSFKQFAEAAADSAAQASTYFTTFTKGFEDAFVRFVQTGKLNFKDLANSIIADFARIQAKKALTALFSGGGGGGGGGGLFGGAIIPGFLAAGGPADAGKPYIVGEQGPELFVPRNAGRVIPNHALAAASPGMAGSSGGTSGSVTQVTYNIQATDAASFKAQLARDPSFLHSVVEAGRRSTPSGARR